MVFILVVNTYATGVMEYETKVTVLTDITLSDHSALDKHFQTIIIPDITIAQWKERIKKKLIDIKCPIVWIMVGNAQTPWDEAFSATSQMKKLIMAIVAHAGRKLRQIIVGGVMPRPQQENLLEHEIREVNLAFQSAVKEAGKARNFLRKTKVMFVATQNLFLEKYTYFDFEKGQTQTKVRVIRPKDKNFVKDSCQLNPVGLYHLRSYILKVTGVLGPEVNSWSGMKSKSEPIGLQNDKKRAYLKAKRYAELGVDTDAPLSDGDETGLEDEEDRRPPIVIHVGHRHHQRRVLEPGQSSEVSSTTSDGRTDTRVVERRDPGPMFVQGRKVQSWDFNVDYDETEGL